METIKTHTLGALSAELSSQQSGIAHIRPCDVHEFVRFEFEKTMRVCWKRNEHDVCRQTFRTNEAEMMETRMNFILFIYTIFFSISFSFGWRFV